MANKKIEKEIRQRKDRSLPLAQGEAQQPSPCRQPPRASKMLGGMPPSQPSTATTLPPPRAPPAPSTPATETLGLSCVHSPPLQSLSLSLPRRTQRRPQQTGEHRCAPP